MRRLRRSRRLVQLLCLVALAGVALVGAPETAGAAVMEQSAWWYRATTTAPAEGTPLPASGVNPTTPATAPGPPTVSAEQLHVEGAATGAVAIAAFTYGLADDETGPVLSLTPDAGSGVPENAVILACRAAIEWTAPETTPGTWESKPLADCATSVQGQVAEDGRVVFPLQPLVRGTTLDVLIVPGTVADLPAGANGSVFSLTFARPGPDAITTTRTPSPPPDFGGSSVEFDEDYSYDPVTTTPESFAVPEPAATFDDTGLGVTAAAPIVEPALEPQDQAPSVPRLAAPAGSGTGLPDASDAARTLGFVLLVAGAVAAFLLSTERQPDVAVIGLGRFRRSRLPGGGSGDGDATGATGAAGATGATEERGVGRLRRPRSGRAPSL